MNSEMLREYNELLVAIPLADAFDWMDDCRPVSVKLAEMKKIYGGN